LRKPRERKGIERAKQLRREMTPPERAMWYILRAHRLEGWKFTRQVPVGPFVIDFAVRRERFGIELDGDSHTGREEHDRRRTTYLESEGWKLIRFTNSDPVSNPEGVAVAILQALTGTSPSPRPSPRRGEGD
jgi:very-short-patch-repair endonuclease